LREERAHVVRSDLTERLGRDALCDLVDAALTVDVREGQEQQLRQLHELAIALDEVLLSLECAVLHLTCEMQIRRGLWWIGYAGHLRTAGPVLGPPRAFPALSGH